MSEPLPVKPPKLREIWLRYVDGNLDTGAAHVLLLLEHQARSEADRRWLCLDCALDALETGEFASMEWAHKVWGQCIPKERRM